MISERIRLSPIRTLKREILSKTSLLTSFAKTLRLRLISGWHHHLLLDNQLLKNHLREQLALSTRSTWCCGPTRGFCRRSPFLSPRTRPSTPCSRSAPPQPSSSSLPKNPLIQLFALSSMTTLSRPLDVQTMTNARLLISLLSSELNWTRRSWMFLSSAVTLLNQINE